MNLSVGIRTNNAISFDQGHVAVDSGTGLASPIPPNPCSQLSQMQGAVMRARHVIAVAFVLVLVGVKLTFLAIPIAVADARSTGSGSVDVFQIHQSITKLPVQEVRDMSFVFPSPPT
jgi:hypothetical protein